jgi:hypothetical protein
MGKIRVAILLFMANMAVAPTLLSQCIDANWPSVEFGNTQWYIKTHHDAMGPGDNLFGLHPRNIYIDKYGMLCLNIKKTKEGWSCAEIVSEACTQEGLWEIELTSDIATLKSQAVLGFFLYDFNKTPAHNEIDIEYSKWGDNYNKNAQFVLHQPNGFKRKRFNVPSGSTKSTHQIFVDTDSIYFKSTFHYAAAPAQITEQYAIARPTDFKLNDTRFRINYWLYDNKEHKGKCQTIKISSIKFTELSKMDRFIAVKSKK